MKTIYVFSWKRKDKQWDKRVRCNPDVGPRLTSGVPEQLKLLPSSTYLPEGVTRLLPLIEISWCYYPNQHICQSGLPDLYPLLSPGWGEDVLGKVIIKHEQYIQQKVTQTWLRGEASWPFGIFPLTSNWLVTLVSIYVHHRISSFIIIYPVIMVYVM